MSNIRKTKKCCIHAKTSFTRANIRFVEHPKIQNLLQTSENQLYQGEHPICQTSEKRKNAANIRKPALPGQTSDMSKSEKKRKVLQTTEKQLIQGKHPICQTSEKPKSAAYMRKQALPGQTSDMSNIRKFKICCKHPKTSFTRANIRYVKHPKNQKVLQTYENQLYQGKHPICQTSEKPKSAAYMRKQALPGQTSDLSNIRKFKICCKHPKTSFTRANIRYVKHPKNQKVLHTCENKLYQGKHQICRTSENSKFAANIRKPALPGRTSDMSNIRKTKKCCIHAKTSFTRANIRYVEHPKIQNLLQTSENQLYQGEHPICQTSEKPKSAAYMRKQALPGQTSDMSNIRKFKICCKHPKTSFTRANIRYVKHPKKPKRCKHAKTSFTRANILYVKHPKNQKVLQTSVNQLNQGKHQICRTSEKRKNAANIRKPALPGQTSDMSKIRKKTKSTANNREAAYPGQTSDMSNIRKTKKCCIHAKTSFTRANIRYVEHPKIQNLLQTSENQLYQGEHPICQTSEKPKSAANMRKPALPGKTSDMSNIRKTKKCCKKAKTSLTRANIRYVEHPKNEKMMQTSENQLYQGEHPICQHPKNQKVLQTSENQLYHGKHPICQTSEKPKDAGNIRTANFPGQTSDMSKIRKTKKCCKHAKTSFTRANIRYVKNPKTKKCCKHPKSSFTRANIRYVKHPKNQKVLQTCENQLYQGKHSICQTSEKRKSAANIRKPALPGQTSDMSTSENPKSAANIRKPALPWQTSDMSNIRKNKSC